MGSVNALRSVRTNTRALTYCPGQSVLLRVIEGGLEPGGAGGLIDFIVDQREGALIEYRAAVARQGGDGNRTCGERGAHCAQLLLRQGENHRDRLHLRHHHDPAGAGRVHDIARIDQANSRAAVDRRGDARVVELGARVVDDGLIDLQLGGELIDQRALRIDGLLAGQVLWLQQRIAIEVAPGVRQQRLILRLGGHRLIVRRLVRTRIDLREQIALAHSLTFGERYFLQLAIDARGHRHRVEGLHGAESLKINRHIGVADGSGVDGNRLRRHPACRIGRLVHDAPGQHE